MNLTRKLFSALPVKTPRKQAPRLGAKPSEPHGTEAAGELAYSVLAALAGAAGSRFPESAFSDEVMHSRLEVTSGGGRDAGGILTGAALSATDPRRGPLCRRNPEKGRY